MKKVLFLSAIFLALTVGAFAQAEATATATASATIVTPISIAKDVDMNFGNVAVSASTAGTVVLATDGSRSATGGVTLPADIGTVAAAIFTVTGTDGYAFTIDLPTTDVIITNATLQTMVVNTFSSNPAGTGTLVGGTATINVGATLNVGAAQASGLYTSGTPFDVTVNYN